MVGEPRQRITAENLLVGDVKEKMMMTEKIRPEDQIDDQS